MSVQEKPAAPEPTCSTDWHEEGRIAAPSVSRAGTTGEVVNHWGQTEGEADADHFAQWCARNPNTAAESRAPKIVASLRAELETANRHIEGYRDTIRHIGEQDDRLRIDTCLPPTPGASHVE